MTKKDNAPHGGYDFRVLAIQGAKYRINELANQKRDIDGEITNLRKFLKAQKGNLVQEVKKKYTKRKKKLSHKQLKAMKINAAKARAAKAKNLALRVKK